MKRVVILFRIYRLIGDCYFHAVFNQSFKHTIFLAVIVLEYKFSDVIWQIFKANLMILSNNATLYNRPEWFNGVDKYEGKSAGRYNAIKKHIEEYSDKGRLARIIGLDGKWGSGKSNIIQILKSKLGGDYFLFEYDDYGHQEDLQRRSFLETLTTRLIIEKGLIAKKTSISIKGGEKKSPTWKDKLKYLFAKKIETEIKSYLKSVHCCLVKN